MVSSNLPKSQPNFKQISDLWRKGKNLSNIWLTFLEIWIHQNFILRLIDLYSFMHFGKLVKCCKRQTRLVIDKFWWKILYKNPINLGYLKFTSDWIPHYHLSSVFCSTNTANSVSLFVPDDTYKGISIRSDFNPASHKSNLLLIHISVFP